MENQISTWIKEVRRYNKRLHLVSSAMEKILEEQVRDTMNLLTHVSEPEIGDLGTGSGFLALPYKIMNPDSRVFLIERSQKKCIFLHHVIDLLGLKNMEIIEADPLKISVGPFPALMSRSFSPFESLPDAVLSTISPQGRFYYFQSGINRPVTHPLFQENGHYSKEYRNYRLNLDVYLVTSR